MIRAILISAAMLAIAFSNVRNCRAQSVDHALTIKEFAGAGGLNDTPEMSVAKVNGDATFSLTFPRFDVYSPDGDLIYHTTDLTKIHRFLKHFSQNAKHLNKIPRTESWPSIAYKYHLDDSPARVSSVQHRYTLLSVVSKDCHACSMEQVFLSRISSRLSSRDVRQEVLVLSP